MGVTKLIGAAHVRAVVALTAVLATALGTVPSAASDEGRIISTVAGGDVGDGRLATQAFLRFPEATAVDSDGNLYIADSSHSRIRRIGSDGVMTTVAGNGADGRGGDGGPAAHGQLDSPSGVSVAPDGSVFIADTRNHVIRRVSPDGTLSTVAVSPEPFTHAVLVDGSGGVYFSTSTIVGHVDAAGDVRILAGDGTYGYSGDGGPAVAARLTLPRGLALAADGSLLIADSGNHRIRRIDPHGTITTVAGTGVAGYSGDGLLATEAQLKAPQSVAIAADGDLVIADSGNGTVRRIGTDGIIRTIYGNGWMSLGSPRGLTVGKDGRIFVANWSWHVITALVDGSSPSHFAGVLFGEGIHGDGGPATKARLSHPEGVAFAPDGALYLADTWNHRIRRVGTDGIITTIAGTGRAGFRGDGGPASDADLSFPRGLAVASDGALFIADTGNNRVRRIDPSGTITTVAGSGASTYDGDGKPATDAGLHPVDVDIDSLGNLYVADAQNHRVRRVLPASGIITTLAGTGVRGYNGDDWPAVMAHLSLPKGVDVADDGTVYVADTGNGRIRAITPVGTIVTIAGSGSYWWSYNDDGGPAISASLSGPDDVAVTASGLVVFVEEATGRVRAVDGPTLREIAGTVDRGYAGDGGPARQARLLSPHAVAVAPDGTIAVADSGNNRIRAITG